MSLIGRRLFAAGVIVLITGCGHGQGQVDTSSTSYQDGYTAGTNCAQQNNCYGSGAEQVCEELTQMAGLNPLPGEDLQVARRGCIDGYMDGHGR